MKPCSRSKSVLVALSMLGLACASHAADAPITSSAAAIGAAPAEGAAWIPLFNGQNLDGWTIKITGHPLGVNFGDTFRVQDGILKVAYDKYGPFNFQFGHLYSNVAYSHYIVRMEYRFEGVMMPDAPDYVNLNSGFMVHSQSPQSMTLDQRFPASLEVQFLADAGAGPRPTANVCTPGTNLEIDGRLVTRHITQSSSPTFPASEWVKVEAEVRGNENIIYRVNGVEVLRYQRPQLDPRDADAKRLLAAGSNLQLSYGHIALQAEGQPVWFRNIELKPLQP